MNAFNPATFAAEYLSRGAYCFDASSVLRCYDMDKILTEGNDSAYTREMTAEIAQMIQETYFGEFRTRIEFDFANKETYGNIEKWHSDAEYIFKGQNSTVNCFFDDTNEEIGGRFDIGQYSDQLLGTKTDTKEMNSFYPKANSILVFNQNRTWLHKVIPSTKPRRMLSFAAQFCDFNHVIPNFQ